MSVSRLGIAIAMTLLATASLEAQATRIGYINTAEVLELYQPARDAVDLIQADRDRWDMEIQQLQAQFQADVQEFQQQMGTMTPEARQIRDQELQNRNLSIQQRDQELNNQLQERNRELFQPIMDKVSATIEEIRVEGGYGIILDAASQAILAADESLNLTQELLNRLEAKDAAEGNR
ncbi:MAG: OmpH family outer membrane protein [Gemmatimonadetes bacterium]|nr:OmpH family outer membrane protein [Gemmatimonadota bacterium]MYI06413.1 OmpH family outer membrane protein [Gemmatimonadota bacterium]